MVQLGYKLSSEEFEPQALVRQAARAEAVGFQFALISDHFHPWIDKQGHSPFVWSVLGGIAQATERLVVGTGVTCPTMRMHPAIVAHASATAAVMLPGRFFLGLGSGENLNEHILGQRWPAVNVRQEMLEEAIGVIRLLWEGGYQDHRGRYFTVENARLYTRPAEPPPIMLAAAGPRAGELAGRLGDGLIAASPDPGVVRAFEHAGGRGKPRYVEVTVCWAKDEAQARRMAREQWPIAGLPGPMSVELPLPMHFEKAGTLVDEATIAEAVVCGPDAERHIKAIRRHIDTGYDHVCVHQVGPDQEAFFRFYEREVLPQLR